MPYSIKYPRKVILRGLFRSVTRLLLRVMTKVSIQGLENIPSSGPLIMVGNHTGSMEVVLMGAYSPRIVEFLGAVEMPWKGWMGQVIDWYGLIPVYRGYTSLETLKSALDVLAQDGVLGVFPEAGFWEPGHQKVQTGAAWLSYKANAPILPFGFGDTRGMLNEALKFKRPELEMRVGEPLPPVRLDPELNKKEALRDAANTIMKAVWDLVPEEERKRREQTPEDEVFSFALEFKDRMGVPVAIPTELMLDDGSWISRFAHRPNLIDSIRDYIFLPVQVLKELDQDPSPEEILQAAVSMLDYVENENPQYFIFRYGPAGGEAFHRSFRQLRDLMAWAVKRQLTVVAQARYEFIDPQTGERQVMLVPEEVAQW